jgi:hypothetical protein
VGVGAAQVVEASPVELPLPAADEKVPLDEAVGGGPHPHHDDPAQDDLCAGEDVLSGDGCEGAAHGSYSSETSNLKQEHYFLVGKIPDLVANKLIGSICLSTSFLL